MDYNQILDFFEDTVVLLLTKLSSLDFTSIDTSIVSRFASMIGPLVHNVVAFVGEIIAGWY